MMMKQAITRVYPDSRFENSSSSTLYLADFTQRTGSIRKVELHDTNPPVPGNDKEMMPCLLFDNPTQMSVACNIFNDHQFKDGQGKDMQHCECVLFPNSGYADIWLAFIEIKDCKAKNILNFKKEVKEQIISTVRIFREKGIINKHPVYGVISFPRRDKTDFNRTIFDDPPIEYKNLWKQYRIHFFLTNSVTIIDEHKLSATHVFRQSLA